MELKEPGIGGAVLQSTSLRHILCFWLLTHRLGHGSVLHAPVPITFGARFPGYNRDNCWLFCINIETATLHLVTVPLKGFGKLLPPTIKIQMPFATEQFPKFPYAVLLWVHATHPTQVFAFGTHSDQGKPHPDALEKNRQDGPLQSDALGMAARPNLLGTSHRIAPLVFSEDRIVVGIGNRKDPDCDAVI